jgi:GAF domain-containing protein
MEPQERGEVTLAREQLDEVTGALEALTTALDDNGALDAALQLVCRQVIQVVPGADMASVTLVRNGKPETAACSDGYALNIDTDQYRAGEGPCLQAAATGEIVRVDIETARELWPAFTRSAAAAGVASYLSAPLVIDAQHAGSLNLYGLHTHGYREVDGALLELYLTAVEAALRATARYLTARRQAAQLSTALVSRAVIEQAKGIIMVARGITAEQAFQVLVDQSQRNNIKLHTVAERFVAAVINPSLTVTTSDRDLSALPSAGEIAHRRRVEDRRGMPSSDERPEQIGVARRLVDALARRTALDEAVGILSCWQRCDTVQARHNLVKRGAVVGQDAEVARMAAVVDAQADGRADPDWD